MPHGTYTLHQNIMRTLLTLGLNKMRLKPNYQYRIQNASQLNLNKKITDRNLRMYNYHVTILSKTHLKIVKVQT